MGSVDKGGRVSGEDSPPIAAPFAATTRVTSTVVNVPNALSALRLIGVPLFLWLVLVPHADGFALLVLMLSGITDYLDGKLARQWNQISRIGQLLDPLADRLYIISTVIAFSIRGVIPLPLVILLLSRDVILAAFLPLLRRRGYGPLPVHFLGKAATFNLLYAFPLLLLAEGSSPLAVAARPVGWAFTVWGTFLYWWAAVLYARQFRDLIAADRSRGDLTPPQAGPSTGDSLDRMNGATA